MKKPSEMTTPELLNWLGQVMHDEIEVSQEDRNALDKEGEARGITASMVIAHYFANLPIDRMTDDEWEDNHEAEADERAELRAAAYPDRQP